MTFKPLPEFGPIALPSIPAASALLFYGGNKLTEFVGNTLYRHQFKPPAFHAAIYLSDGLFLNVGKFKQIKELSEELSNSTRRIDVVIYNKLSDQQRRRVCREAILDVSKPKTGLSLPDYGWTDYLRFGLRFLRPSKKDFCSENVAELLKGVGQQSSYKKPVDTAPWHLFDWAWANTIECDIKTLYVGKDFRGLKRY